MPPSKLGKYEIVEQLGRGAMGVVYRGLDPDIRRTVAIKTLRRELLEDDGNGDRTARFRNEAQAAGRLLHPGIVTVYEYGEEADVAYIAMEYVEGNSLREYFNRHKHFETRDVVTVMAQLLEALDYAHQQGVVHRDIKPSNIIITTGGRLKVTDFGIAHIEASNLTQLGSVMGTPGYMAPEQYTGKPVDRRADIFSSGVVLYQLLTGEKAYSGSTDAVAYKVCHEDSPPPSLIAAERIGTRFDSVVARSLARDPADRFPSAQAFASALLDAYAGPVGSLVSEETVITEIVRQPSRSDSTHPSSQGAKARAADASAVGQTSATPSHTPAGWDSKALEAVATRLAPFIGPVARVVVRRAGAKTQDIERLYLLVAEQIEAPEDRARFLAGRNPPTPTRGRTSVGAGPPGPSEESRSLTTEAIERATRTLNTYLGPIAKIVVKRAAAKTSNHREFHRLLADELPNDDEKRRFLESLGIPR